MKLGKRMFWSLALALALAGIILWSNLCWAQGRQGGGGPWCPVNQATQTSQDTWQGRGQGNTNCPYYPGVRRGPQGRGGNARGFQGQQGPGRNAPNPPANPSNVTQ